MWRHALLVLLSLVPGAVYVSVINDFADRRDDLAAGKPNRLDRLSALFASLAIGAGVIASYFWRHDALLLSAYLAAWLAFSLYSLPPFRFKNRGLAGVVCDASGAHVFPTLVAVILAFRGAGRPIDIVWLASVGAWAFGSGLRGILWHQLTDLENDWRAGVRTFAALHPKAAIAAGTYLAFPIELLGLGAMFMRIRSIWPLAFLAVYAVITALRVWHLRMKAVIVAPRPRYLIVLNEYYEIYLAPSLLIASADWVVLAIHVVLFPNRTIYRLWRGSAARLES